MHSGAENTAGGGEPTSKGLAEFCRAVIVTAIPVEFSSVCEHLERRREEVHPHGTVYERGSFPSPTGDWDIIVVEAGPGNVAAAAEIERAISYFRPHVTFFVGVAGGLKDVALGDVVAATKVYGYESGKDKGGFKPRPAAHQSTYRLVQRAKAEARNGTWQNRVTSGAPKLVPRVAVAPIAAGEKVVADKRSTTFDFLTSTFSDAVAVEMEGIGFLQGAYMNSEVAALIVRGISDLIDGKADADQTGSQERASRHASAFCFEVLVKLGGCPFTAILSSDDTPRARQDIGFIQQQIVTHEARFERIEKSFGFFARVAEQETQG